MDTTGMRKVTPSKPDYWHGTASPKTAPLTLEQVHEATKRAARLARDRLRLGLPDRYVVRFFLEPTMANPIPREVAIECPTVSCTRDRKRICLIAPSGHDAWMPWK